jgi:putative heme-binding domain-containing protein
MSLFRCLICFTVLLLVSAEPVFQTAAQAKAPATKKKKKPRRKKSPPRNLEYAKYAIFRKTAPMPGTAEPISTRVPLKLAPGDRIALVGNTLLDRAQFFGHLEALLHQRYPKHKLVVRNLAWSADTPDLQPRPANFASVDQHLTHEKADVIFAAFGFNESFSGEKGLEAFRKTLTDFVAAMKSKAYNGKTASRIVLISPVANENIKGVAAADLNNANIKAYADVIRQVAAQQKVGFVDVFTATKAAAASPGQDLTINGAHLGEKGYALFAKTMYQGLFGEEAPKVNEAIRQTVLDKNRQYFRRYRPVNTFYYTGGRNRSYGYLDFLPAMRNFDLMAANRDSRVWDLAQGKKVPAKVDDSNVPPLPRTKQSRGANRWMSAADEFKAFKIDPRFEVNLFAGEEEFPDIAAPIQMRWDSQGRLWVACSTTYPHVYPGNEPNDKLVILEDTDGDGKADKSSLFADDLHIPLSFEFGDGGVYVSEMPHLTFIKDTNGDGRADLRRRVLTGFGTEDSHHALHDLTWTPDGDLIFRESVFHHSQVETPYGPVRQQNSGWFRFQPRTHRLTSFGTYSSTNPWGVTFDDWGQHMASHPIFASAFHSLDPPYPKQHPRPGGLRAYSGVCGQEFIDFSSWPKEMQGQFIKVRYKPTNRVEILSWKEGPFGYDEKYLGDLIFSSNLSFIPVDLRYGPRGAMYVCDWYNPVKGHAQYSLRDERRDRHSGRIWRITAKGHKLQDPSKIAGATIPELLDLLKRREYRYRYWAKRELRAAKPDAVKAALDTWVKDLKADDPRFRHHQLEGLWAYRVIGKVNTALLRELLACEEHHARAAATRQLRYWHAHLPNAIRLLAKAANDPNALVRMEAVIAASYIGTKPALDAMMDVFNHPIGGHLAYAANCALGSHTLRPHWQDDPSYNIAALLKKAKRASGLKEPNPNASQAQFDSQKNLKKVKILCMPERMRFSVEQIAVTVGQPLKIVFANGDATDHNMVFVKAGALAEVGMAANEMAKDPKNANSDFIPAAKKSLILHASPMIGPTRKHRVHVFRFNAPKQPGIYPYVCTFPGHWVVMKGELIVAKDLSEVASMLAARKPTIVKQWTMKDFKSVATVRDEKTVMRGMQAFIKARCNQCHQVQGHGVNLGPDLSQVAKKYKGVKLLRQLLEPSHEINEKYRTYQFLLKSGVIVSGVIIKDTGRDFHVARNLLTPKVLTKIRKGEIDEKIPSRISPMPSGMLNVLTKEEIAALLSYLEAGGYKLPTHLKHKHAAHGHQHVPGK